MKKILFFVDRLLPGGVQSFVKTISEELLKSDYEISCLVLDDGNDYSEYEKRYLDLGIVIHKLDGVWLKHLKDFAIFRKSLNSFFSKNNSFDVVHINSGPKNYLVAKYAKKYGIKKIIYHSHNTDYQTKNPFKKMLGRFFKGKITKFCNEFLSCSYEAGKWMFPKKILKSDSFAVIHNPIDIDRFAFDFKTRNNIRKELGLVNNEFIIGNVGRLCNQKNQEFLINVFHELYKYKQEIALVLVGQGYLEERLKAIAETLECSKKIYFLGYKDNVDKIMNAFDLFVMPSYYEGYPIVSIEAQANGLPCLFSDTITKEALLHSKSAAVSLKDGSKKWASFIFENYLNNDIKREAPNTIKEYTPSHIASKLIAIYNK